MQGVYIPHFAQISVKVSVLGVLYPYHCTEGGEIWHQGGDLALLHAEFHPAPPSVQRVAPMGRKCTKSASE